MSLRQKGTLVITLIGFGACLVWDAKSDYEWAPAYTVRATRSGWFKVADRSNFSDPTRPWTLFKTPCTSLWLIDTSHIVAFDSLRLGAPLLSAYWDYSSTEEFRSFIMVDLESGRIADVFGDSIPSSSESVRDTLWKFPKTRMDTAVFAFFQHTRN